MGFDFISGAVCGALSLLIVSMSIDFIKEHKESKAHDKWEKERQLLIFDQDISTLKIKTRTLTERIEKLEKALRERGIEV